MTTATCIGFGPREGTCDRPVLYIAPDARRVLCAVCERERREYAARRLAEPAWPGLGGEAA